MRAELLAPAGSYEGLRAAVQAGADAVYIGGQMFGARAYANNPDTDELLEAIDFTHLHGKKIYMTVNTLLKNRELEEQLYTYLAPYYEQGVDAVIVQDYGVLSFIRREFPGLPIHVSTQMAVTGPKGAALMKEAGASRIVTARELSLQEIREYMRRQGWRLRALFTAHSVTPIPVCACSPVCWEEEAATGEDVHSPAGFPMKCTTERKGWEVRRRNIL